jgi:DNA-binding transcriptional regulator YiaG
MSDLDDALDVVWESGLSPADKAKIARLLELCERSAADLSPAELREAREGSGLSVGQAARLFGVFPSDIRAWESGEEEWPADMVPVLNEAYMIGGRHG